MKDFLYRLHERWLRRPLRVRSVTTPNLALERTERLSSPAVVPSLNLSEVRLAMEEESEPTTPDAPPLLQRHSAPAGVSRVRQRRHAVIELPAGLIIHEPVSAARRLDTARRSIVQDLPARMLSARSAAKLIGGQCAICLCDYQANEDVACMPCDGLHMAHARCLRVWLEVQPTCPVCRWSVETCQAGEGLTDRMERAENELAKLRVDE